jgi:hypothetical protein
VPGGSDLRGFLDEEESKDDMLVENRFGRHARTGFKEKPVQCWRACMSRTEYHQNVTPTQKIFFQPFQQSQGGGGQMNDSLWSLAAGGQVFSSSL